MVVWTCYGNSRLKKRVIAAMQMCAEKKKVKIISRD